MTERIGKEEWMKEWMKRRRGTAGWVNEWMNEWGVLITLLIDSLYLISGKYSFNYWTEEIQFSQGLIY